MCFTLEWSVGIFSFQIALSTFVWLKCKAWPMRREGVALILWFALMEFIQVVNYLVGLEEAPWNGGCKNPPLQNKLLVVAGYVHVCFQPLVTHYLLWRGRIRETGPKDPSNERFIGVLRMLIISTLIDLTGVLEPLFLGAQGADVYDWEQCGGAAQPVAAQRPAEWPLYVSLYVPYTCSRKATCVSKLRMCHRRGPQPEKPRPL